MPVNLSVKNVPEALAERLRERARRNNRSLQRELMEILEQAAGGRAPMPSRPSAPRPGSLSIEQLVERARELFPQGTPASVALIRQARDARSGAGQAGRGRPAK